MTEAMPFLQKAILLSYDPRPLWPGAFCGLEGVIKKICLILREGLANNFQRLYNKGDTKGYFVSSRRDRPAGARCHVLFGKQDMRGLAV